MKEEEKLPSFSLNMHVCKVKIPAIKSDDMRISEGVAVGSRDIVHCHLKMTQHTSIGRNFIQEQIRTTKKPFSHPKNSLTLTK